ncbi:MAG: hypothetical protein ACMXYE_00610 [Candidatus Woesearchaeota archaeon]
MKKTISATINSQLADWIKNELSHNSQFRNKSHLIERALEDFKSAQSSVKKSQKTR